MIDDEKYVHQSFDQLTTLNSIEKKTIQHHKQFFISKSNEKKYSYHSNQHPHQKYTKLRKSPIIDVSQLVPLGPPSPISPTEKYFIQIKNLTNEKPSF